MQNSTQYSNHVFSRFWIQAAGRGFDRQVWRAQNGQGRRAIKFQTEGFHKALIVEANHRPGFEVRLCDLAEKSGLVNSQGIISFASPAETERLETLIRQIDQWTISYEIIFGDKGEGIGENSESPDSKEEASGNESVSPSADSQSASGGTLEREASGGQANYEDWDQIEAKGETCNAK